LVKTIHRAFFALFALVENDGGIVGETILAQRKLLYLEKLFASLLLGAPLIRDQLRSRLLALQREVAGRSEPPTTGRPDVLLRLLQALQDLTEFWVPAAFRIGYLARCCTWEGRSLSSATMTLDLLEQTLVLLVQLTKSSTTGATGDPYVRTISAALLAWQSWHSSLPGCCYQEETCEAMLSRFGHRCDVYRNLHGFEATFNLYLTLTQSRSTPKDIRGVLRQGLVQVIAARMRRIIYEPSTVLYALPVAVDTFKTRFVQDWPDDIVYPGRLAAPTAADESLYVKTLHKALVTLVGKKTLGAGVAEYLDNVAPPRPAAAVEELEEQVRVLKQMHRPQRAPPPRPTPKAPSTARRPRKVPRACQMINVMSLHPVSSIHRKHFPPQSGQTCCLCE
jgi:hypothetical protein